MTWEEACEKAIKDYEEILKRWEAFMEAKIKEKESKEKESKEKESLEAFKEKVSTED